MLRRLPRRAVLTALTVLAATASAQPSESRGRSLYESRCVACHSVQANRSGPLHAGVLGRRAASVPGFLYSPALARSGLVWSRANLLLWLADASAMVPGQAMAYQVRDAQDREDLVAYLASLAPLPWQQQPACRGLSQPCSRSQ